MVPKTGVPFSLEVCLLFIQFSSFFLGGRGVVVYRGTLIFGELPCKVSISGRLQKKHKPSCCVRDVLIGLLAPPRHSQGLRGLRDNTQAETSPPVSAVL